MKQIKLNENLYLQSHENGIIIHLPDDQSLKIDEKEFFIDFLYEIKKCGMHGKEKIYKQLFFKYGVSEDEFDEMERVFRLFDRMNNVSYKLGS